MTTIIQRFYWELKDSALEVAGNILSHMRFKVMTSFIITILGTIYVPIANLIPFLIFLMIFDFVLGVWRAAVEDRLSSTGFHKGFYKIILYMCGISVICFFAGSMKEMWGTSLQIEVFSVGFLCANETLSCLAHLSKLGFPVPEWLVKKLTAFHDDPYQFMQDVKKK